eukprot:SAG22_NODE_119_length_19257_cov_43.260413_3_plen_97_part_00
MWPCLPSARLSLLQVEKYSIVFWEKGPDSLAEWEKTAARIEDGEKKVERLRDQILAFGIKCDEYDEPVFEMEFDQSRASPFGEQVRVRHRLPSCFH